MYTLCFRVFFADFLLFFFFLGPRESDLSKAMHLSSPSILVYFAFRLQQIALQITFSDCIYRLQLDYKMYFAFRLQAVAKGSAM